MAKRLIRQGDVIRVGKEDDAPRYLVITQNDKGLVLYCPENGNWANVPTETVRERVQKNEWSVRVPAKY